MKTGEEASRLWGEAASQVGKGWLEGPLVYTDNGKLLVNGKQVVVNPAYRFGVQRTDK